MANQFTVKVIGLDEFRAALARNPQLVVSEAKKLIQRIIAQYKSGIINNPWRIGMSGGGAPVKTGNLRDTHQTFFQSNFLGMIYPTADYAQHVHKKRPWMEYVFKNKMKKVEELEKDFLKAIVKDLAR